MRQILTYAEAYLITNENNIVIDIMRMEFLQKI